MRGVFALLIVLVMIGAAPPAPPPGSVLMGIASLSVSASSSRVALPSTNPSAAFATLLNDGSSEAFFKIGNSSVVATTDDYPLPVGNSISLYVGNVTYVAAITATGTTTLRVYQANGPFVIASRRLP